MGKNRWRKRAGLSGFTMAAPEAGLTLGRHIRYDR